MRHFILTLMVAAVAFSNVANAAVVIEDVQLRYGIGNRPSVIYGTFTNHSNAPVYLIKVDSPAFGRIEMHNHIHDGNIMRMRKIERITLPPYKAVSLKSGGLHLMAFQKAEQKDIQITFTFDNAPPQTLSVGVIGK